jgi:hypothetical protein
MEQTKFTEEELQEIKNIQQEYQNKVIQFGQLELEKIMFEKRREALVELDKKIREELSALQFKEKQIVDALNAKYGPGELNPQTGEFVPAPVRQ